MLAMFLQDRWYGRSMQLDRYPMIEMMADQSFANFAYLGMLSLLTR